MKKLSEIITGPEAWHRGDYENVDWYNGARGATAWCLLGALRTLGFGSLPGSHKHHPEILRLAAAIKAVHGVDVAQVQGELRIAPWQDDPQRTWEEISAVIDWYDRDRMLNP